MIKKLGEKVMIRRTPLLFLITFVMIFITGCGVKDNLEELKELDMNYTITVSFRDSGYETELEVFVENETATIVVENRESDNEVINLTEDLNDEYYMYIFPYLLLEREDLDSDLVKVKEDKLIEFIQRMVAEELRDEVADEFKNFTVDYTFDFDGGKLQGFILTITGDYADLEVTTLIEYE